MENKEQGNAKSWNAIISSLSLDDIKKMKHNICMAQSELDGLRKYEDNLIQGIQTNRFAIKKKEEDIFQLQSGLVNLIEQYKNFIDSLKMPE